MSAQPAMLDMFLILLTFGSASIWIS